jgi:hypothetical protein
MAPKQSLETALSPSQVSVLDLKNVCSITTISQPSAEFYHSHAEKTHFWHLKRINDNESILRVHISLFQRIIRS